MRCACVWLRRAGSARCHQNESPVVSGKPLGSTTVSQDIIAFDRACAVRIGASCSPAFYTGMARRSSKIDGGRPVLLLAIPTPALAIDELDEPAVKQRAQVVEHVCVVMP
jgi:hypothetical protein